MSALRSGSYCPAPRQHVLRPSPVSTLFPQLSPQSRRTFGLALAFFVTTLTALVMVRWQAASIGVAALGFPVLLGCYLYDSGALRRRRFWLTPIVLGAAIGVTWGLLTGAWLARTYGVGFGAGVAGGPNSASLGVPVGAVLLMVLPAVLVRLKDPAADSVMHGSTVGVLGATSFGVAATVVRLWPQLATGLVARHRPMEGLLIEAGIRGVVIPMTSAAIGGIAGVALWFSRSGTTTRRRPLFVAAVLIAVAVTSGTALVDATRPGPTGELVMHATVTVIALYGLRWGLHLGLLYESYPTTTAGRCPECSHLVRAQAFCPDCGRAVATWPERRVGARRLLLHIAAGLAAAVAAATAAALILTKPVALYSCPPECGRPPTGTAVHINPRFTATDGSFSVDYPAPGSAYDVTTEQNSVVAVFNQGDGGELRLMGEPAAGRSAEQVVHDFLARNKPTARRAYPIPNPTVGYQTGYGEVADDYPVSFSGGYLRLRLVTLAAIKDDVALIAAAIGPFHQFGPDFGPGPPSAVSLQLGLDMDNYVNSFRWRGDADN